jgi:hypothetical protein
MNIISQIVLSILFILLTIYLFFPKVWGGFIFYHDEAIRFADYLVSVSWKKGNDNNKINIGEHKKYVSNEELPDNIKNMKDTAEFVAATPIDYDNSGKEAVFVGGNKGQHDSLLVYNSKTKMMENKIEGTGLDDLAGTHTAVSIDLDKDGWVDLIIGRQNGVFLYKNNKDGTFKKSLLLEKQDLSTPMGITITDFNKDGNPDIYVSQFIDKPDNKLFQFHNDDHSKKNVLLQGIEDGSFKDVTKESGIDNANNTFTSIFTDVNNDGYPDLINVNDTGKIGFFENQLGQKFKRVDAFPFYGSYMGVSLADIDNDGDIDYYFSNVGNSVKVSPLSRGNLKDGEVLTHDHILLRNDGNFKFVDIAKEKGINDAGFSWGPLFTDLNLDSHMDLLVSQNFAQLTSQLVNPLPSQRWLYDPKLKKFVKYSELENRSVGQTPLSIDIDGDGINDVLWINMVGPSRAYKVKNVDGNNYINVKIPDNLDYANAKITVTTPKNNYTKEYIIGGVGLSSDTPSIIQFGLGKEKSVNKITIELLNGKKQVIDNPTVNSMVVGNVLDKSNVQTINSSTDKPIMNSIIGKQFVYKPYLL